MPAKAVTERARCCRRCGTIIPEGAPLGQCPKCLLNVGFGAMPAPNSANELLAKGRLFGDYELLELVARGGMGLVYRARQISLNRIVALKMISTGDLASRAAVERFRTEAEAAARLEHPHIVPFYEFGVREDQHYFTMRFLEGATLIEAMARYKLSIAQAVDLMITISRAVHYAHRFGVLHRDIKPGNILFDEERQPFVADFGLAKLLGSETGLTRSAAVLGTPGYMAPEQITGAKQVSTAADVYSLGAVLYELLTGRPPFSAATPLETMRLVLDTEPRRPRFLNSSIDRDLETICLRCLEKESAHRYGSAEDLANDLNAWSSHRPLMARPVTTTERVLKWARRKPAVASLVIALHLIGGAGLLGIIWQAGRANQLAALATAAAERATDEAAKALVHANRAEAELWKAQLSEARAIRIAGGSGARVRARALLEKLVQRPQLAATQSALLRQEAIAQFALTDIEHPVDTIAKSSWEPLGWNRNVDRYLNVDEWNRLNLYEFPSQALLASFPGPSDVNLNHAIISPDEQYIAAAYRNGTVRLWRAQTGESLLEITLDGISYPKGVSFSEDGCLLQIVSADGLLVQSLNPVLPIRTLRGPSLATFARFAPDSRSVAAIVGNRAIEILDLESGELLCHHETEFSPQRLAWHPDRRHLAIAGDRGRLELHAVNWEAGGRASMRFAGAFIGHQGYVDRVSFSFDGNFLFSTGWDYFSIIWDVRTGRPLLRDPNVSLGTPHSSSSAIVVNRTPDNTEGAGRFMPPIGFQTLHSIGGSRVPNALCISPDQRFAATAYETVDPGKEGECFVWTFPQGTPIGVFPGRWAHFSADSRAIFAFEREGNTAYRYSLDSPGNMGKANRLLVYEGGQGERVNAGTLIHNGRILAIAASDAIVFLDIEGEQATRRWNVRAHEIEVSANSQYLSSMFHNDPSVLWHMETQREVFRGPVFSHIGFSPDNQHFFVSTQRDVQVRRLSDQQLIFQPIAILSAAERPDIRFSQNGSFFALLLEQKYIRLIETDTGRMLAELTPPSTEPNLTRMQFTPDDQWLAVTGMNGDTIGWNLPIIRHELRTLGLDWTVVCFSETVVTSR